MKKSKSQTGARVPLMIEIDEQLKDRVVNRIEAHNATAPDHRLSIRSVVQSLLREWVESEDSGVKIPL